jgi:hypothetical protein
VRVRAYVLRAARGAERAAFGPCFFTHGLGFLLCYVFDDDDTILHNNIFASGPPLFGASDSRGRWGAVPKTYANAPSVQLHAPGEAWRQGRLSPTARTCIAPTTCTLLPCTLICRPPVPPVAAPQAARVDGRVHARRGNPPPLGRICARRPAARLSRPRSAASCLASPRARGAGQASREAACAYWRRAPWASRLRLRTRWRRHHGTRAARVVNARRSCGERPAVVLL